MALIRLGGGVLQTADAHQIADAPQIAGLASAGRFKVTWTPRAWEWLNAVYKRNLIYS